MLELKNSIFAKTLRALYKMNLNKSNEVHSVVIDAIFKALVMVEGDLNRAKLETAINTATGIWLDYWGDFFSVPRERKEADKAYSQRIIQETIEPKVTVNAIKRAAARWLNRKRDTEYTQDDISLFEPWKYILKYSQRGLLSGVAKMTDGDYWRYAVVDVSIPTTETLSLELISYLNTIKAAGVQIVYSYRPNWGIVDGYETVNPIFGARICNQFTSYIQPYVKEHIDGLYPLPDSEFIGMDDSDFSGGLNDPYHPLSGYPKINFSISVQRELPLAWSKIRLYEDSPITRLEDIATVLSKDYEETTIGDMLSLENEDNPYILPPIEDYKSYNIYDALDLLKDKTIDSITPSDLAAITLSDEKLYEIMYEFNITLSNLIDKYPDTDLSELTVEEIINIKQDSISNVRNIGRLSHSLLPVQITSVDNVVYRTSLALNSKDYDSSPLVPSLIESGFLKGFNSTTLLSSTLLPQDVLGYYSYESPNNLSIQEIIDFENTYLNSTMRVMEYKYTPDNSSYVDWLSESYLEKVLGEEYIYYPISELATNTRVICELLKVEPICSNVLLPTVITTIQS